MNPFSSGTRLRDMIRAIRACKTAAEERAVVRKESAAIRASINENDQDYRHRNLAKLMFIHMLGYPTHFGQMECLKLIASAGFPEKRIGYLGLMLLLDERQEVLMLVTNSLKQDLNHSNQYIVGLALCALGNICSAEMARDLAPEVERLLQFRDPNIRKKWAFPRSVPDLMGVDVSGDWNKRTNQLWNTVILASLWALWLERNNRIFDGVEGDKCTEGLVKTLKDVVNSPYSPEYDIAGITDPFLHIRLLKLLRVLGQGDADSSDCMNDILAQVATKTESNKNAGNAILYECVETIMSIEDNGGLRVLAINILGRFLSNRDNNIRYVALNMLMKAITVDAQAVQRHRATILECVKDSDASIRKRALELVYLLVNESNVKPLTKELIDYLEVSDQEFKGDLTAKICSIVAKFSLEKIWYIDQMLKVLTEAGNFVKDEVWHALIVVISNASDLHGYTVRALYRAFQTSEQESLVRVAVWCIGEYGDMLVNNVGMLDVEDPITVTESDAVDVVEIAIKRHTSDFTTKAMAFIAMLKLSSRFPSCSERIKDIIVQYKGNLVLELQQRSLEFNSIIAKHQNIRSALVERMPVLDEATFMGRRAGSMPATVSTSTTTSINIPNGVSKPSAAPLVDLLDLSSDDTPAVPSSTGGGGADFLQDLLGVDLSPAPNQPGMKPALQNGTDVLLDLLSIGDPPAQSSLSTSDILSSVQDNKLPVAPLDGLLSPSAPATPVIDLLDGFAVKPPTPENNGSAFPSIVAFESSLLKLLFNFSKPPGNPQTTLIQATFTNLSSDSFTDFIFQAAVPKFLQLHLDPASGNTLPASGNGSITQSLKVTNSQHGKKSLVMRIKIAFKMNNKDVLEEGQINNFPRGL
ncbi:AP-1 complex subunit gamma-2 [Morus notabilis]|uniref:AP-1 complex subunit gamma n=1 Tax=Morus notabilis TaxID=981085 RepID=W9S1W4_9ROSA|nr:AP-1 complex subunit gamma-2 [Morus notabilis]